MAVVFANNNQTLSSATSVPTTAFSVLVWAKLTTNVGASLNQTIFSLQNGTATTSPGYLALRTSAGTASGSNNTITLSNGNGIATFNTTIALNSWVAYAVTVTGTTMTFYRGTDPTNLTVTSGTLTAGAKGTLRIGNNTTGEFWQGSIANVKLFDVALTAGEIAIELAQYQPSRTLNLNRWYHFVNAPDLVDYSGEGLNLTAGATATTQDTAGPPVRWARSRSPRIGISATPILGIDSGALSEDPSTLFVDGTAFESVSLNDATPSIAVTTAASESFSFGETASIFITSTSTDSNFFSEQPVSSQLVWDLADSATLGEGAFQGVTTSATDSGALTDSPGVVLQLTALTANDQSALTDSSLVNKTELRFPTETFSFGENAVSVQFADQQVTESFGLMETATVSVITTASDSFALVIENKTIAAIITTNEFATLNEVVTQLTTSLIANDAFGFFIEDGQVDYKDIPEWIYATIGTGNVMLVDVDTANHLQSVLDAPNTIRTNISTKFWYSDIETEGRSGDTEVPATHGGDVDSKTYYASILEP